MNVSGIGSAYYYRYCTQTRRVSAKGEMRNAENVKQAFMEASRETGYDEAGAAKEQKEDYRKFLQEKTEEILEKLRNGETEVAYPIGAEFFTEEEWDKLLEKVDSIEETLRELMREAHAKREKEVTEAEQRETVGQFSSEWNLRFAAHENFWTDFLKDEIDLEGFMEFMKGTNKGIPDYSVTVGDSMYIDKEKVQWAKYLNPLGIRFYTAEEMYRRQAELMATNTINKTKITDSYDKMTVEKAEGKETKKVLGLTMMPYNDTVSYGMSAFYSEKSTEADPVIRINSNYGGEEQYYDIHVNKVDPENATQLEMFALSCYLDDQGVTKRGSFGSYVRIKAYAQNDVYLGRGTDLQRPENAVSKIDWLAMLHRMEEAYLQNVQTYTQYLDCERLTTILEQRKR